MNGETRALVLSAIAACIIGVVALAAAVGTGSGAILLDGGFNLAYFATALVTLRVARLLERPDDHRFPFGYMQFEPLINLVKGLLILGVALLALVNAVVSLARGGQAVQAGPALAYALFATGGGIAVSVMLRRLALRTRSPLVDADVGNWIVNAAISGGMVGAFLLAMVLERNGHITAARYVDPILVGLVVLLTLSVPVRTAARSLSGLLQRAPDGRIVASIESLTRAALGDLPLRNLHIRVVRPGRTTYALIHALVDADAPGMNVRAADRHRRAVIDAIAAVHAPVILDLLFTAETEFAEPTTGFGPPEGTRSTRPHEDHSRPPAK